MIVHYEQGLNQMKPNQSKGGYNLADIEFLKDKMTASGMTTVAIAEKANILRETLYNRLNGKGEFTASEIVGLTNVLGLTRTERDKIFLS